MGQESLREVRASLLDPREVEDGSAEPRGGSGRFIGPSRRSVMGWRPSVRYGTGRGNVGEVRDGSSDPLGGSGQAGHPRGGPGRIGDPRGGPERV